METERKSLSELAGTLVRKLKKNKFIAAALILGLVLLLLPIGNGKSGTAESGARQLAEPEFSLEEQEEKLESALGKVDGAGRVRVVLTLSAGTEREVLTDDTETDSGSGSETVTVQSGSGKYEAVTRRYVYPRYQGALVVCEGGGNAAVRLALTEAVSALTGLGSDKITVVKMKK